MQGLKEQLMRHEGMRQFPYKDSVGKWTIGIGRNLSDNGISYDEAMTLLDNDLRTVFSDLDREFPWWRRMNQTRRNVLANMCFNLGITRLKGFRNTMKAMRSRKWVDAASHMMDSKWARQVGRRANELSDQMVNGRE